MKYFAEQKDDNIFDMDKGDWDDDKDSLGDDDTLEDEQEDY